MNEIKKVAILGGFVMSVGIIVFTIGLCLNDFFDWFRCFNYGFG